MPSPGAPDREVAEAVVVEVGVGVAGAAYLIASAAGPGSPTGSADARAGRPGAWRLVLCLFMDVADEGHLSIVGARVLPGLPGRSLGGERVSRWFGWSRPRCRSSRATLRSSPPAARRRPRRAGRCLSPMAKVSTRSVCTTLPDAAMWTISKVIDSDAGTNTSSMFRIPSWPWTAVDRHVVVNGVLGEEVQQLVDVSPAPRLAELADDLLGAHDSPQLVELSGQAVELRLDLRDLLGGGELVQLAREVRDAFLQLADVVHASSLCAGGPGGPLRYSMDREAFAGNRYPVGGRRRRPPREPLVRNGRGVFS